MTLRCKTVEYVFPQLTSSLASATRNDFAAITLAIPEVTSRTFLSVEVDIMCVSNAAAGANVTARLIGISLGAIAVDDQSIAQTLPNGTTEQTAYHLSRNVTAYFNANFGSGTSQTCGVSFSMTGVASTDHTVKLIITYQYDDAGQDTRVKTIRVPLDSKPSALTAVLAEIGSNQVPLLDTFLPESTVSIQQVWFEILGNNMGAGTTASFLGTALDAAAEVDTATAVHTPNTANLCRHFSIQTGLTTSTTHAFMLRTSSTQYPYACVSIVMHVTYTYSHTSSTRILNSVMLSAGDGTVKPGKASTQPARYTATLAIAEPGTLTLRQSGVVCWIADLDLSTVNARAGSQPYRAYNFGGMGSVVAAGTVFSHRIDAGAGAGTGGLAIAAGALLMTFDLYSAATGEADWGSAVAPVFYVNYESDKNSTLGDGAHNHTTMWANKDGYAVISLADTNWTPTPPAIPEAAYYASAITFHRWCHLDAGQNGVQFQAQVVAGETNAPSWMSIHTSASAFYDYSTVLEDYPVDVTSKFRQYPAASTAPSISASRIWRSWTETNGGSITGARIWITYHAVTTVVAGTVSGFTGSGSGITVDCYSATKKTLVATTVTTAGGAFSMNVYDGDAYFTVAAQDATHTGRSATNVGI